MSGLEALRRSYAEAIAAKAGAVQRSIVDAFASVRREQFLGAGPWHIPADTGYVLTPTDDPAEIYQDILVALALERGINNGEPSLHAKCIGTADPQAGDIVIHVGAGTGYYTAIFAQLVGEDGHVYAYEIERDLAVRLCENLVEYRNVSVHAQSAFDGQLPSADVIYVSAGATHVPSVLLDALAVGGRLILPLIPNERLGCMLLVTRRFRDVYAARIFSPAGFIPCIGARDEAQSRALAAALDSRSTDDVHSLRRGDNADDSAWCVGTGWWLSTAEPM